MNKFTILYNRYLYLFKKVKNQVFLSLTIFLSEIIDSCVFFISSLICFKLLSNSIDAVNYVEYYGNTQR